MTAELVAELYSSHGYVMSPEEAARWFTEKQAADKARIQALEMMLRDIVDADDVALAEMKACGIRPDNVVVALTEKARALLAE